jgi:hypothetical protein
LTVSFDQQELLFNEEVKGYFLLDFNNTESKRFPETLLKDFYM